MKKVIVVMPAYCAEKTLAATVARLPKIYDEIIVCDDASGDRTVHVSEILGLTTLRHPHNKGYGGNQKTLYTAALKTEAEIVIMIHPDNQYATEELPAIIRMIQEEKADFILGSRMARALENGMPWWKFVGNRFLTKLQNLAYDTNLSEFHSGLRAFRSDILAKMPYNTFSDDFVFDSECIAWLVSQKANIKEWPVHCYYHKDSSSIGLARSMRYGLASLKVLLKFKRGNYN